MAGPSDSPAPPIPATWTGFYLGGNVGVRSTQTDWIAGNFVTSPKPDLSSQSFSDSAFRAGAYGGFNWQFLPRFVAGVEGDWGRAPKTTMQGGLLPGFAGIFFPILPGDNVSVRTTWDASARARLGFLLTPSVMIFGAAGRSLAGLRAAIGLRQV